MMFIFRCLFLSFLYGRKSGLQWVIWCSQIIIFLRLPPLSCGLDSLLAGEHILSVLLALELLDWAYAERLENIIRVLLP